MFSSIVININDSIKHQLLFYTQLKIKQFYFKQFRLT